MSESNKDDSKPVKFVEGEEKRDDAKGRQIVDAGTAIIYDLAGKIITRGTLKNLSPGGAGVEIPPGAIAPGTKIVVGFMGNGLKIISVQATVQWIRDIENHPQQHRQLGIKFHNPTQALRGTLEAYFAEVRKQAKVWT